LVLLRYIENQSKSATTSHNQPQSNILGFKGALRHQSQIQPQVCGGDATNELRLLIIE
jgi:hypothetical protein